MLARPKACVSRSVLGPQDAAFCARATRDRLDADALHQLQIDEHAAVADGVAREAVASATHGDWQARITCEGERRDDVGRAGAAGNRGWTPIDHPVPDLAHCVVTRVGCRENGAAHRGGQGGGICQLHVARYTTAVQLIRAVISSAPGRMTTREARPAASSKPRRPVAHIRPTDAWWVEPLRLAAAVIFPVLIVFGLLEPWLAGRVFWTVAVASLPLIFVIAGYHRWRRICPLALVAQLPASLGRGGTRRAGPWLQAHAYHLTFGVLVSCLWLRLVATNGDGYALTAFLAGLCRRGGRRRARVHGQDVVQLRLPRLARREALHGAARAARHAELAVRRRARRAGPPVPTSTRRTATGRRSCSRPSATCYFAFPGVVLAFYGYYFLQAGRWSYYFSGEWTHQVGLVRTAFADRASTPRRRGSTSRRRCRAPRPPR